MIVGTIVYLLSFLGGITFSNFIKAFFCKIKGYSVCPLLFYPIYVYRKDGKLHIKLIFEWSAIFRDLYPEELFLKYCKDKKEAEKFCVQLLKVKSFSLYMFFIILALLFLICFFNLGCFLFEILLIYAFAYLSKVDMPYYHGNSTKIKNITNNKLIIYLAKEICIYNIDKEIKRKIYFDFNEWLLNCKNYEEYSNFIATIVKHMFVEEYSLHDTFVDNKTFEIIKSNIINRDEIKMGLVDESWELLKVYLAYSVINYNKVELDFIIRELRFLKMNLSFYVKKFGDMIDWYISIAKIYADPNERYKYPFLISKDRFSEISIYYKNALIQMEFDVWSRMEEIEI